MSVLSVHLAPPLVTIAMNDPSKRNAMGVAMFDELEHAISDVEGNASVHIVLLRGEGSVFCAGFDLAAVANQLELMEQFIWRLSRLNRALRRMPQVVVAAVQGAAIAGGCAVLSACDFVFAARDAVFGYPVHRIGVSPAVTIPTLFQAVGNGAARSLLMSGELINAAEAHSMGLVTHLCENAQAVQADAEQHCQALAHKGTHALRVTKRWLNELDGSLIDKPFDGAADASASISVSEQARQLIASWQKKSR